MGNSLSSKNINKVHTHNNECHSQNYVTIDQVLKEIKKSLSGIEKTIKSINHNELKGIGGNEHIDWTKGVKKFLHKDNIPQDAITQYEKDINHNNLKNHSKNEHIDWTVKQSLNIHNDNIETPTHNSLKNISDDEHTPHSRVIIEAGTGLLGGGSIITNRRFDVIPATINNIGGVSIGNGLNVDKKGKISIDPNIFPYSRVIEIKKDDWVKEKTKFFYSFESGSKYPIITCWDTKYNKIIYPEIRQIRNEIRLGMKRSVDMLIKIMG